jgi:hypothetical protein
VEADSKRNPNAKLALYRQRLRAFPEHCQWLESPLRGSIETDPTYMTTAQNDGAPGGSPPKRESLTWGIRQIV